MTNIEQTIAEIRRRDDMYPTQELTAGAVKDRRTLLHIIDQLQGELAGACRWCDLGIEDCHKARIKCCPDCTHRHCREVHNVPQV